MQYCPKCDNIMDIGRSAPKISFAANDVNPTSLSITEKSTQNTQSVIADDDNIIRVINMLKNNIDISNEKVNFDELMKHKEFTSIKDKEKKEYIKIIKNLEDDSMNAYVICKNCTYSEKLIKRVLVLNRMSSSKNSTFDNFSKYKYMKYDNTLPHTRDYVCKNKDCSSHKDPSKRDAVWFRPIATSYSTYYGCTACATIWNIS